MFVFTVTFCCEATFIFGLGIKSEREIGLSISSFDFAKRSERANDGPPTFCCFGSRTSVGDDDRLRFLCFRTETCSLDGSNGGTLDDIGDLDGDTSIATDDVAVLEDLFKSVAS